MGGNELFITLPYTEFQPTHPVWGETNYTDTSRHGVTISIHPSRVGWDAHYEALMWHYDEFQSTHPVWDGTTTLSAQRPTTHYFNPPIPCGMGPKDVLRWYNETNFNPPIPCGMGQLAIYTVKMGLAFQSTHPVWDGTKNFCQSA